MSGLFRHRLPAPRGLIECDTVLDIGAGIRPTAWYAPKRHVCVEPYAIYADRLRATGMECMQCTAREALRFVDIGAFDAIYMLDSLEHMTREEGAQVLQLALAVEPKQIVVYTPLGFLEQHGDAWGLGGAEWQEHRSGWLPKDFPGWTIEERPGAFFAIWTLGC